jgi:hypothetical protein
MSNKINKQQVIDNLLKNLFSEVLQCDEVNVTEQDQNKTVPGKMEQGQEEKEPQDQKEMGQGQEEEKIENHK